MWLEVHNLSSEEDTQNGMRIWTGPLAVLDTKYLWSSLGMSEPVRLSILIVVGEEPRERGAIPVSGLVSPDVRCGAVFIVGKSFVCMNQLCIY